MEMEIKKENSPGGSQGFGSIRHFSFKEFQKYKPLRSGLDGSISLPICKSTFFFSRDNESAENERKFKQVPPIKTKLL
jgi:hypothetical protein